MTAAVSLSTGTVTRRRFYRAVWRWHFYAGLVVVPFLTILALTGVVMLYGNSIETALGARYFVAPGGERASLAAQAQAAVASVPGGQLKLEVDPALPDRATVFVVASAGKDIVVSVDPHGPRVVDTIVKDDTWYAWANRIHGTLLLGTIGDRIQEIVAGLGIVLLLTGITLWWPRGERSLTGALMPDLRARGRLAWKEVHVSLGFYIGVVLLFFLISGMAWTGIWGTRIVQAWSTLPAVKLEAIPLSDKTHAAMNHADMKEVPWALEQAPMPASGSHAGMHGLPEGSPVDLDTVAAFARSIGFDGQFRINVPQEETGVYTVSADSMDGDTTNAMGDRTVHIDRYTGKVLADVGFADYSLPGKAMAVGIALHQGNLGLVNTMLNLLVCLSVLTLCVSGIVMWWKRRPVGRFGAPRYAGGYRAPVTVLVVAVAVCATFPLTGIAVLVFATIDWILPKRFKEAGIATPA